jgi:hypothetical protein
MGATSLLNVAWTAGGAGVCALRCEDVFQPRTIVTIEATPTAQ